MNALLKKSPMNELIGFDPFSGWPSFQSRLSKFQDSTWAPAVDISEDDDAFIVTADLPDMDKKDINVSLDNGVLSISGERHHESEESDEEKKYHLVERSHGSFFRSFSLPKDIDAEKVTALCQDGVLKVTVPKTEAEPPAKEMAIEVK